MPYFHTAADVALMAALTDIGVHAAATIRRIAGASDVRTKADGSPVTTADEASEAVIRDGLARLDPVLPIISEEQAEHDRPRVTAKSYFLVDPLDGTREFIAGRDEYAVNIALMTDGAPVLGIIAAPALGLIWRGIVGRGAERIVLVGDQVSPPETIHGRPQPSDDLVAMISRSHIEARTQAYLDRLPSVKRVSSGSALKFCRLAEGSADLYPRLAPTRDWDVAAGHAIVTAAGGRVTAPDGTPLVYGTADLVIPGFLAWGDATIRG